MYYKDFKIEYNGSYFETNVTGTLKLSAMKLEELVRIIESL
jgi:hypothetical protein